MSCSVSESGSGPGLGLDVLSYSSAAERRTEQKPLQQTHVCPGAAYDLNQGCPNFLHDAPHIKKQAPQLKIKFSGFGDITTVPHVFLLSFFPFFYNIQIQ